MVTEPRPPVPPAAPPPPPPPDFEEMIKEWEKKAREHMELARQSEEQLSTMAGEAEMWSSTERAIRHLRATGGFGFVANWEMKYLVSTLQKVELTRLREDMLTVEATVERNDFYSRLYYQVPLAIMGRKVANADDVMLLLQPPVNVTTAELDSIRDIIDSMFDVIVRPLPEMALEAEVPELPELVPPPTVVEVPPTTIQRLTIDAIIKQLTAPDIPPSVMTEEEWAEFMVESGQISDKADLESVEFLEAEASRIIDEWQERNNMLEAYRTGIAEMPDYGLVELMKEIVIQPGMALLQIAQIYFEHVSMPLAGLVYGPYIPDLDAAFQRYRKTESTWMALGHSWEEWDAPGEGAAEWILKYMLMEGLVDPMTYVGWGIAARIAKPFGRFGRLVMYTERGIAEVLEVPFDLIKAGLRRIPKTVGQKATLEMAKAGQYVDKYMTQRFGRALYQMTMDEWAEGVQFAVKHTLNNPQVDSVVTRAGKELMKHQPVTGKQTWDWARRLETTLRPEDITKHTVDSVDQLFEAFFRHSGSRKKLIVPQEAADELVRILFGKQTDDISTVASKILLERRSSILAGTRSFNQLKTPFQAIRQLMRRNRQLFIATDASEVALAKLEMGRISTLLTDVPIRVQKVWASSIDKWIIRPFAESYLTFALYGPMNVVEDIIRTGLGGVKPGRKSPEAFMRKWAGVSYDREILRDAASETIGFMTLRSERELHNWILQIGGLAKGFGTKTYHALVEYPGQIGISIRRHFLDARATQIMKEMSGESFEALTRAGPDRLMGVTDKRIIRDVQQAAMELKIQGLPDALRAAKGDFTRANIMRREVDNILKEHPDLPTPVRNFLMRQQDDGIIFREGGESINRVMRDADGIMIDDFIASPERASAQYEQLADFLTQLEVRNPQEMAQLIQSLNLMSSVAGATPKQILARATERTRGLPFAERRLGIDKALDSVSVFRGRANVSMDRVTERIRIQMSTVFPDNPQYISKAENLFNLQTAKRLRSSELGENINAWRHEVFAAADPSDIRAEAFWDDFYRESSGRWDTYNVEMADFDGMIKSAIDDLDIAGGVKRPQRPAIKVVDRELSPQDVAQLMGVRGDDITRSMLDVMTAQNDRDMFVSYVMAHVKQGDVGFNKQSVGAVYDQLVNSLQIRPENMSWVSGKRLELDAVRNDLHTLYNSKLLPDDEVAAIGRYLDDTANAVEKVMYEPEALTAALEREGASLLKVARGRQPDSPVVRQFGEYLSQATKATGATRRKALVGMEGLEDEIRRIAGKVAKPPAPKRVIRKEFANYDDLRQSAMDEAHKWYYKEFTDYTNANQFDAIMKAIYPFWCTPEYATILTRTGWKHHSELVIGEDVLTVNPDTLETRWEPVQDIAVFDYDDDLMVIPAKGKDIEFTPNHRWLVVDKLTGQFSHIKRGYELTDGYDLIPRALPHEFPDKSALDVRDAAILGWCCTDGYINRGSKPHMIIYQSLHKHLLEIQELTGVRGQSRAHTGYSTENSCDFTIRVANPDSDRILTICPDWTHLPELVTRLSEKSARAMWDAMFKGEGSTHIEYTGMENSCWKQKPGPVMEAFQILSILLGKAITVRGERINLLANHKPYQGKECRRMFTKHYKGKVWCPVTPSGTWFMNCNGSIVPTGNTYESQRWFWLPRSFVRHPGTFTAFERWQDNTDYGYMHIPGTSVDIGFGRGTVYGTLQTRLARRDYPEYYDSLDAMSGVIEFNDFLTRYGFYPGAHIGIPLAMFFGAQSQAGEITPALVKTPLDILMGMFPDNETVRWITDHVFGDRFKNHYLVIMTINRMGGDGTLIFSKMQENQPLTPEEEQIWTDARREVGWYSVGFEQFSLFRWRADEQYEMYEKAGEVIELMTGYTPEQQDWMRKHGYRLWDIVGGMSPTEQAILQEMDYYRWVGNIRPLLPGKQQEVLNQVELGWNSVEKYGEGVQQTRLQLQHDFLSGARGPDDYNSVLLDTYDKQGEYILTQMEDILYAPIPEGLTGDEREEWIETHSLMTLEGRKEYYKEFGVPQPVLHPMRELLNLYFSIKLRETTEPETGEIVRDWDNFWAQRQAIEDAIPDDLKQEWGDFLARNSTRIEEVRREVYHNYFRTYNKVWEKILSTYSEPEQVLIEEYLHLERTGQQLARQAEIKATVSEKTGNLLISSFRSEVADARRALRYHNPQLDAWLYFWGKTSTFVSPTGEDVYRQLAIQTGRKI